MKRVLVLLSLFFCCITLSSCMNLFNSSSNNKVTDVVKPNETISYDIFHTPADPNDDFFFHELGTKGFSDHVKLEGIRGEKTDAKAYNIDGYSPKPFSQETIDYEIKVVIEYERNSYTISASTNNSEYGLIHIDYDSLDSSFEGDHFSGTALYGEDIRISAKDNDIPNISYKGMIINGTKYIEDEVLLKMPNKNVQIEVIWELKEISELSDFTYEIDGDDIIITGIKDKTQKIVSIPSCVTKIGDSAFKDSLVEELHFNLGSNIKEIGSAAFKNCANLEMITNFDPLVIESEAFMGCTSLYYFSGKDSRNRLLSTKEIKERAFMGCTSLERIEFSEALSLLGESAFENCYKIDNITIPRSLKTIDKNAFKNCVKISSIVLSEGLSKIKSNAFKNCTFKKITLPSSLYEIEEGAFSGCQMLEYMSLPFVGSGYSEKYGANSLAYIFGEEEFNDASEVILPKQTNIYGEVGDAKVYYIPSSLNRITITGSNKINDYAFKNCNLIKTIIIESELDSIESDAFMGCTSLEMISLPDTLRSIGENAFNGCIKLAQFRLPSSLEIIRRNAFNGCTSLLSISFNDNLKTLESNAFSNCTSLRSVVVPETINSYGYNIFSGCMIEEMTGNVEVIKGTPREYLKRVTITGGASISDNLFKDCTSLLYVSLPSTIKRIGEYAFYNTTCEIVWNNPTIEEIGNYSFSGYKGESLTLPSSINIIGNYAFSECINLKSIVLPDSLLSIGKYAFSECTKLESVTFNQLLETIFNYAFSNCTSLLDITLPSSLTNIYGYAFNNCSCNIVWLSSEGDNNTKATLNIYAFANFKGESLTLPSSLSSIQESSFEGATCEIVWNNPTIEEIGDRAFYGYSGTSFTLPSSVISVGKNAFVATNITKIVVPSSIKLFDSSFYSYNLEDVYYNGTINDWFSIKFTDYSSTPMSSAKNFYILDNDGLVEYNGMKYSKPTQIEVPDTISTIDYQLVGFNQLTKVSIPSSVKSLGEYAFDKCTSLTFNKYDNANYLGNADNPYVILMIAKSNDITSIEINNNTKIIYLDAFYSCTRLSSVTIPSSVEEIGARAFSGCTSLESVIMPENIKEIRRGLFSNCTSLNSLTIPSNVTYIGNSAFNKCTSLTSINIPDSVTYIGESSFRNCTSLSSISISNESKLEEIGISAFADCTSLTSIFIPSSVKYFRNYAFDCKFLNSVYYGGSIADWCNISIATSNYSSNPMYYASSFYILDDSGDIEYNGKHFSKPVEIVIPNTITSIGKYQFYGLDQMTSLYIPSSVTSIGDDAFHSSSLKTVVFDDNSKLQILSNAFRNCASLELVKLPSSLTTIENFAFYGCSSLKSIVIPKSVTKIKQRSFEFCYLEEMYFEGTKEECSNMTIDMLEYDNDGLYISTKYYYSETMPSESGNYWHYVNGEIVKW